MRFEVSEQSPKEVADTLIVFLRDMEITPLIDKIEITLKEEKDLDKIKKQFPMLVNIDKRLRQEVRFFKLEN